MHTLEQIKAFTPQERNEFIDGMVEWLSQYMDRELVGLCWYAKVNTNIRTELFFLALKIPILKKNGWWFTKSQTDRILFLKSIKTCE